MFAYQWGDEFKRLMDFDKKKIPTFPNLLKNHTLQIWAISEGRLSRQAKKESFTPFFKVLDGKTLNKLVSIVSN